MKMQPFFAAIVAALCLLVVCARGEGDPQAVVPGTLPDSLPMLGSEQKFLDWIVSNRVAHVEISVQYTTTSNTVKKTSVPTFNAQFLNYENFRQCVYTNGVYLYNLLLSRSNVASEILFRVDLFHLLSEESSYENVLVSTNIGFMSDIAETTFYEVTEGTPKLARAVLPVPGLEKFVITVDSDLPYSYEWNIASTTRNTTAIPPPPTEFTRPGEIAFNRWYSTGEFRVRFIITAGGVTRVYTQHGDYLGPAELGINEGRIRVTMATGSDTVIQRTTDFDEWEDVMSLPWTMATNHAYMPLITSPNSQEFFRAVSQ